MVPIPLTRREEHPSDRSQIARPVENFDIDEANRPSDVQRDGAGLEWQYRST